MKEQLLTVIGGGASGLIAAGCAAMQFQNKFPCPGNIKIQILEKMHRPGLKLGITGKGRCNLSNTAPLDDFIEHFRPNPKFLYPAFNNFFSGKLIEFLNQQKVKVKVERGGRIFPQSDSALQVANTLIDWNRKLGVDINTGNAVQSVKWEKNNLYPFKIMVKQKKSIYLSSAVIISTGGITYPLTGSSGDGYKWAQQLGHRLINPLPDLVGLYIDPQLNWDFQGSVSLKNVMITLSLEKDIQHREFGEAQLSKNLFEGPVVLKLSRFAVQALQRKQQVYLYLDLKPALSEKQLDRRLIKEFNQQGSKSAVKILKCLIPLKLVDSCLSQTGVPKHLKGGQLTSIHRKKICQWIKYNRFKVKTCQTPDRAIITAGGVHTDDINPKTMMSKIIPGLFFSGEIIDYAADTGGFNLQAAFSTGWLAGKSSIEYLNSI
ncbi:MAG: NAD(P)/FAD-dependent oxidoreductase [bacterium]